MERQWRFQMDAHILKAKAEELNEELTRWARREQVLLPGEVLVCRLEIETRPLVETSFGPARSFAQDTLEIAGTRRPANGPVFLCAAVFDSPEVGHMLAYFKGSTRGLLHRILVENLNNPTKRQGGDADRVTRINQILRGSSIEGKHYRVASQNNYYQLWEVRV
jgi:hypothetical protein